MNDLDDWASVDLDGSARAIAWTDNGDNDICPSGFSVPTQAELVADTVDATTTDIENSATAFDSFLNLPVAGSRSDFNGSFSNVD